MYVRVVEEGKQRGFSLIELVVVIAVLAVLAGVLIPQLGGVSRSGKAQAVLRLVDTVRQGCVRHHTDTGAFGHEYSGYSASHRELSAKQGTRGWKGPYMETPLTHGHNPFGGSCHLYETLTPNNWIEGFDLDGDGKVEAKGAGNTIWLSNVEAIEAEDIDSSIDKGVEGSWWEAGRVRYIKSRKYLLIMVYRP